MTKLGYCIIALVAAQTYGAKAQVLKSNTDSVSYSLGMDVASSLSSTGVAINMDSFLKGMTDGTAGNTRLIAQEEGIRLIKNAFSQAAERKVAALKQEETTFFETIKNKDGVRHLQDGLYYEVLQEGTGAKPADTSEVTVHYKGSLANGKVFDSSYDRGQPLELDLDNVIRGWQLGIPQMSVGSKYRFYIPSSLGYGERGAGGEIPPYSALIFEIELIGIKEGDATN
ncbi:FKBP-type peptidyl-prolyl cis-trans isomerase [Sphingobacterium allocomposti]|nr:FKBP-type peptidyl-prolyl cis-trans isomerase [Sphingobacterium composti Yoo et al. 2007 non Ten et al. 2007]